MEDFLEINGILLVLVVAHAVILWGSWSMKKQFAPMDVVVSIEKRLVTIEGQMQALPSVEVVKDLSIELANLRGDIRSFKEIVRGHERQVSLLLENELRGAKR